MKCVGKVWLKRCTTKNSKEYYGIFWKGMWVLSSTSSCLWTQLLYWTATKQQLGVAQKGGSGWQSAPLKLKRSAPCTPGFLSTRENLPPRWYTHRYGEGSWASSQGRLWPFLGKHGRYTDRYRGGSWSSPQGCDQSWASLGPPLTYMYIPGVHECRVYGGKSVTIDNLLTKILPLTN